jgi:hypothetical protein
MRGTGIEKEVEICATNIANKTSVSTNAMERGKIMKIFFCEKNTKKKKILGNVHPALSCSIYH